MKKIGMERWRDACIPLRRVDASLYDDDNLSLSLSLLTPPHSTTSASRMSQKWRFLMRSHGSSFSSSCALFQSLLESTPAMIQEGRESTQHAARSVARVARTLQRRMQHAARAVDPPCALCVDTMGVYGMHSTSLALLAARPQHGQTS